MGTSKSLLKQIQKYTDFYLLPLLYIQCEVARGCSLKDSASSQKVKFCPSGKKKKEKSKQTTFSHECLFGNAYYEYHRVLFHCSCLPPVKNTFKLKSHQAQQRVKTANKIHGRLRGLFIGCRVQRFLHCCHMQNQLHFWCTKVLLALCSKGSVQCQHHFQPIIVLSTLIINEAKKQTMQQVLV